MPLTVSSNRFTIDLHNVHTYNSSLLKLFVELQTLGNSLFFFLFFFL